MDGAGLNEEHVALVDRHLVQHVQEGVVLDLGPEFLFGNVPVHAEVQGSALIAVQDVPHLGFAVFVLHPQGVFIAGVYLDGQGVLGVDELNEHGEVLKGLPVLAQDLAAGLLNIVAEGQAVVFPAPDHALSGGMGGELPALGHDVQVALLVVFGLQARAAPEVVFKRGFQLHHIHGMHTFLSTTGRGEGFFPGPMLFASIIQQKWENSKVNRRNSGEIPKTFSKTGAASPRAGRVRGKDSYKKGISAGID